MKDRCKSEIVYEDLPVNDPNTGSIGFLGIDGGICLNIAIRTVIVRDSKAFAQTGGGIVADSEANAEWDETITKARALLAGITAVQQKHTKTKIQKHKYVDTQERRRKKQKWSLSR